MGAPGSCLRTWAGPKLREVTRDDREKAGLWAGASGAQSALSFDKESFYCYIVST